MKLDFTNIALLFLILGSIIKIIAHFQDRKSMHGLRRDMRFCYTMMRVWALEGEWPDRCREKLLEVMAHEDIPAENTE